MYEHKADYGIVAFHCQQAMEKSLKGFILQHTNNLIEGHSLIYLCKSASNIKTEYKCFLKDCAYVNQFYIETRYPADIVVELKKDEEECISITEKLLQIVNEK